MVQEVQTWVWITNETTLETIEAVGTSSFKIKEWRQTTARYLSECTGTALVTWSGSGQSPLIKWTVTLDNSYWKSEFIQTNWGIRIPKAWTYQLTFTWQVGGVSYDSNFYIKNWPNAGDKNIYTYSAVWYFYSINESFIVDLGKFDIITVWADFYRGSGSGSWMFDNLTALTIKQL